MFRSIVIQELIYEFQYNNYREHFTNIIIPHLTLSLCSIRLYMYYYIPYNYTLSKVYLKHNYYEFVNLSKENCKKNYSKFKYINYNEFKHKYIELDNLLKLHINIISL